MISYIRTAFICSLLVSAPYVTGQTDHGDHMHDQEHQARPSYTAPKVKGELEVLSEVPASGKSRESGFDGRSTMETTSARDNLRQLCAKGSRGLVVLDNKTWQKCGGRPKGLPDEVGKVSNKDHTDHSAH